MLLKIVYGIGQNVYLTDIKSVSFVAHHAADATVVDLNKTVEMQSRVLFSNSFLLDQVGCSPEGNGDSSFFLNRVTVETKDAEPETIYFTGTAYLCDDKGNTVDTLR